MNIFKTVTLAAGLLTATVGVANASIITDPADAGVWQGATLQTFADFYYSGDRDAMIADEFLDDGYFVSTGFVNGTLVSTAWATGGGGGCICYSTDTTGTGSLAYLAGGTLASNAGAVDQYWFQSSAVVGETVFDLGFGATMAVVFNSIDHGPLPDEAIESTVYLSNDLITWTQAVVLRVWLEGQDSNLGILWDGFTYAVGTGTTDTFRYASVIHGGPGALRNDGDDEINAIMGLHGDFTGETGDRVPEPGVLGLLGFGLLGLGFARRKRRLIG